MRARRAASTARSGALGPARVLPSAQVDAEITSRFVPECRDGLRRAWSEAGLGPVRIGPGRRESALVCRYLPTRSSSQAMSSCAPGDVVVRFGGGQDMWQEIKTRTHRLSLSGWVGLGALRDLGGGSLTEGILRSSCQFDRCNNAPLLVVLVCGGPSPLTSVLAPLNGTSIRENSTWQRTNHGQKPDRPLKFYSSGRRSGDKMHPCHWATASTVLSHREPSWLEAGVPSATYAQQCSLSSSRKTGVIRNRCYLLFSKELRTERLRSLSGIFSIKYRNVRLHICSVLRQ